MIMATVNGSTSVETIPSDVFELIFQEFLHNCPPIHYNGLPPWVAATSTCRRWRSIATNDPRCRHFSDDEGNIAERDEEEDCGCESVDSYDQLRIASRRARILFQRIIQQLKWAQKQPISFTFIEYSAFSELSGGDGFFWNKLPFLHRTNVSRSDFQAAVDGRSSEPLTPGPKNSGCGWPTVRELTLSLEIGQELLESLVAEPQEDIAEPTSSEPASTIPRWLPKALLHAFPNVTDLTIHRLRLEWKFVTLDFQSRYGVRNLRILDACFEQYLEAVTSALFSAFPELCTLQLGPTD